MSSSTSFEEIRDPDEASIQDFVQKIVQES
jgi:hypothetical protein